MASLPHLPFLVLTFCFCLILFGKCEAHRGGTRHHSGLVQGGRYYSRASISTISTFSAYREKLTQPCGYRPTVGKRSAPVLGRRGSRRRLVETGGATREHQPTNFLWQLVSQNLLEKSFEGDRKGRTRREVLEQSIGALELRNLMTGIQFIITEHLLLQVNLTKTPRSSLSY